MTCHPLSLRRQLLFEFEEVSRARFEFVGADTVFRVLLNNGHSGHNDQRLHEHLTLHQVMCASLKLEPWAEGRNWPPAFDALTARQRELAETCDSTASGIEATVVQAFAFLSAAKCESPEGGAIRVIVQGKSLLSSGELAAVRDFIVACEADPRVVVDVVPGTVVPEGDLSLELSYMVHQTSRAGVYDSVVFRVTEEDEDLFREARTNGFRATASLLPMQHIGKRGIYLPRESRGLDLSSFIPLYDVAYIPVEPHSLESQSVFGLQHAELTALMASGRVVPVFTRRLGEYQQGKMRALLEAGACITPRRLAAASASQMLDANPLWRVATHDEDLAKATLADTIKHIRAEPRPVTELVALAEEWVSFQRDGCLHFLLSTMAQSAFAPATFGPGALLAKTMRRLHGKGVPDLEMQLLGIDVSHAMALNAALVPDTIAGTYRLYELLTLYSAARPADDAHQVFAELPFVSQLDQILRDFEIRRPPGMSMDEWVRVVEPMVRDLRKALASTFAGKTSDLASVQTTAMETRDDMKRLERANKRTAAFAERFELVGIAADTVTLVADLSVPYGGTLISALLKFGFPRAWTALERSELGRRGKDLLEGMNAFVSPNTVRLHRIQNQLRSDGYGSGRG